MQGISSCNPFYDPIAGGSAVGKNILAFACLKPCRRTAKQHSEPG